MFTTTTTIIVDADPDHRLHLIEVAQRYGAETTASLASIGELQDRLAQNSDPNLIIVNLDPHPAERLQKLARVAGDRWRDRLIVMSAALDSSLLMEVIRLGMRDFLPLPLKHDNLGASIEAVTRRQATTSRARMIHFIPVAGGCGATTIACNVAISLAAKKRTLLIDLDLRRGAVADALDLHPRYSIAHLMDPDVPLDRVLLENALTIHRPTSLAVLVRPEMPEDSERVTLDGLTRLLHAIEQHFEYVVIDSGIMSPSLYLTVGKSADLNVLITQQSVTCTRNAERLMEELRRAGIDSDRIRIVLNRFSKKGLDVDPADMEQSLRTRIAWRVPNDFRSVSSSLNVGQPLMVKNPRGEISACLSGLAESLNGKSH